jgi:hypothetical protein
MRTLSSVTYIAVFLSPLASFADETSPQKNIHGICLDHTTITNQNLV